VANVLWAPAKSSSWGPESRGGGAANILPDALRHGVVLVVVRPPPAGGHAAAHPIEHYLEFGRIVASEIGVIKILVNLV
jgi:hypothetical protein